MIFTAIRNNKLCSGMARGFWGIGILEVEFIEIIRLNAHKFIHAISMIMSISVSMFYDFRILGE